MTLVRKRRHQEALRVSPPPSSFPAAADVIYRSLSPATSPVSNILSFGAVESLSDLERVGVLGQGYGSTIYKVCHKKTSSIYALKVLRFHGYVAGTGLLQLAACEAHILKMVDSPYVVKCHGVFDTRGFMTPDHKNDGSREFYFVMEYLEGGSLLDLLRAHQRLPEQVISDVAKRVLQGLRYLHAMQIVHRDIKPSNLLINGKGQVKIADFGVSKVVNGAHDDDDDACESLMGTYAYMSPERLDPETWNGDNADSFSGDVWSLGLVLLQCLTGQFPLVGPDQKADWATLMCVISFGERLELPETASPEFQSFIWRCLEKEWRKRATVNELLDHPFVNKTWSSSTDP